MLELALAVLITAEAPKVEQPAAPKVEIPKLEGPKVEFAKPESKTEVAIEAPHPADAGVATAPAAAKTLPPAVTQAGLCAELNRNGLSIQAQRKKLEEERKDIAAQRAELEKLSADITKSRAELRAETEKLEGLLAGAPAPSGPARAQLNGAVAQGQLETLAKAVKGMKPEAAAALMQRTDPKLAAQLLQRMKPADAGAVMNHLKPDLAADLLAQMATLPAPRKP